MERITATLPLFGETSIDFHDESQVVIDKLGGQVELNRLNKVAHLGLASSVFTGANHTRLEYLLLQFAIIGQISKLHKGNQNLALSGDVKLNGINKNLSSGQELLKIWFLLSSYGRPNWTYGVERTILSLALENKELYKWLTTLSRFRDINSWCKKTITNYNDSQFHFVLTLLRISFFEHRDRSKNIFTHYLRNLLLPVNDLFPDNSICRYKLYRLRILFNRIRLLSIVALDSYYSHFPINLDLQSSLNNIGTFQSTIDETDNFDSTIKRMASWLADEVYLHPKAACAQRCYENEKKVKFLERFNKTGKSKLKENRLVKQFMHNGLGQPIKDKYTNLLRLTFPLPQQQFLGFQNLYQSTNKLQREIANPPITDIALSNNTFSNKIHLDLNYDSSLVSVKDLGELYSNLYSWLNRSLIAECKRKYREIFGVRSDSQLDPNKFTEYYLRIQLSSEKVLMIKIFKSLIQVLLPLNWTLTITDYIKGEYSKSPILVFFKNDYIVYDEVTNVLKLHINNNPLALNEDRIKEIEAVKRVFQRKNATFKLVCIEKMIIRDRFGTDKREWDGIIVEISSSSLNVKIIEAKNIAGGQRREKKALEQLHDTYKICFSVKFKIPYEKTRLKNLGAVLKLKIWPGTGIEII